MDGFNGSAVLVYFAVAGMGIGLGLIPPAMLFTWWYRRRS